MEALGAQHPIRLLLLDYGGVVADHYSQPFLDRLAGALHVSAHRALELVSESSPHGRQYRLGSISRSAFCDQIGRITGYAAIDPERIVSLWAQTYIPNVAMLNLVGHARSEYGIQVGLLLNEDEDRMRYLEEIGIPQHFDFIVASCRLGALKPDAEVFRRALQVSAATNHPSEVLFVDDRTSHVDAAAAFGFRAKLFVSAGDLSLYLSEQLMP